MKSVFLLHHSYETDDREETKLIGVYTSEHEAGEAIKRLKSKPGFKDRPNDFIISECELNKDHWTDGYSVMTTIMVKDVNGNWKSVAAAVRPDDTYEIVEKYESDLLGEFKDTDIVRCEEREEGLFAIEKVSK